MQVPVGTLVYDAGLGELLADLDQPGAELLVARGGWAGKGNLSFRSSTNRTPRKATPGGPSQERLLGLELRLLADVGVVGFPNAGKSTLVASVSSARPRIADYPFSTLVPNLGVVDRGIQGSWVIADIPGLIEGAASGAGLGHRFLRHVQRTRLIIHLVSALAEGMPGPAQRYRVLREELERFDPSLSLRKEILVLSRIDVLPREEAQAIAVDLEESTGKKVWLLSAVTRAGLKELLDEVWLGLQA